MMLAPVLRSASQQVEGDSLAVFTRIFEDDVNLVCWRRSLCVAVTGFVDAILRSEADLPQVALAESVVIDTEADEDLQLSGVLAAYRAFPGHAEFVADITQLAQAFVCLFDVRRVGLRLRVLDHAMCPRWHVDQVPVRLITTYSGPGSEWLGEDAMPRQALGSPATDQYADVHPVGRMNVGDVALFKGERWHGNEQRGIVHRSPRPQPGAPRLVVTLDWLG